MQSSERTPEFKKKWNAQDLEGRLEDETEPQETYYFNWHFIFTIKYVD